MKTMKLTCMPETLQLEHGIKMNVLEAPGRKTSSDATLMARDISLEFAFPVLM